MKNLPHVHRKIEDLRTSLTAFRRQGKKIALVPTMGALHDGHLSLIEKAKEEADIVLLSIFVNPKQFAPGEDYSSYPRNEDADISKAAELGVNAIFAPTAKEMYPSDFATTIQVSGPAEGLETDHRPHFFTGVATVVTKLLTAVMPDVAIFGEKDYQQLRVVKQLVKDLHLPIQIVGAPTIREEDGLALSSRNNYLAPEERQKATALSQTLMTARNALRNGENWNNVQKKALTVLKLSGFKTDYFELRNGDYLTAPINLDGSRILVAAKLGDTRLIDNIEVLKAYSANHRVP